MSAAVETRPQGGQGAWYNVNFPYCAPSDVTGARVVPTQRFDRSPMRYFPSDNPGKFFIAIPQTPTPFDPANDFFQLLHGNAITVTPMRLQASDVDHAAAIDGKITHR